MEEAFRVVNTLSDALGPIACIRFSPDGNRMAGASLDGNVYIYSVLENFKLEVCFHIRGWLTSAVGDLARIAAKSIE